MTLLVAAVSGQQIWFVADTAVTGPGISLREREFTKKIEAPTARSIVGFSGDTHIGQRAMRYLAGIPEGELALNHLKEVTKTSTSLEFAYGLSEGESVRLYRISKGILQNARHYI